jgi:hypothetical protein
MPLLQYLAWVGSFLVAALLAATWYLPALPAPRTDVPLDQKIHIRIHTDHKWPERVVFDTVSPPTASDEARAETSAPIAENADVAEAVRRPSDAFAEMAPVAARPCFRPPCPLVRAPQRNDAPREKGKPVQNGPRVLLASPGGSTSPNPFHMPRGKS